MDTLRAETTRLLREAVGGEASSRDRLWEILQRELHTLAENALRRERGGHTLQATALANEAYLRLVDTEYVQSVERGEFKRLASTVIRNILVDHGRMRKRRKRGGDWSADSLGESAIVDLVADPASILDVHEALKELETRDARAASIVEMRFFGGMTFEEIAPILGVSARWTKQEWAAARAWLVRRLCGYGP